MESEALSEGAGDGSKNVAAVIDSAGSKLSLAQKHDDPTYLETVKVNLKYGNSDDISKYFKNKATANDFNFLFSG